MSEMRRVNAYQKDCAKGFSLDPVLQAEIDKGMKGLEEEGAAVNQEFSERAEEMIAKAQGLAQKVLQLDPHKTERDQLDYFQCSLDDLKRIRQKEAKALAARKTHLAETKSENRVLKDELRQGRDLVEKNSRPSAFGNFARDVAIQTCTYLSGKNK